MKSWHLITWGIVLWSSLLLAGCSGLPLWLETPEAKRNPAASVAPLTAEQAVLQQFAWVQRAAAEQLERELPALEEVFALQPVERHRLEGKDFFQGRQFPLQLLRRSAPSSCSSRVSVKLRKTPRAPWPLCFSTCSRPVRSLRPGARSWRGNGRRHRPCNSSWGPYKKSWTP